MCVDFERKQFEEPTCTISTFRISDIIASSAGGEEDDWGVGIQPIGLP